MTIEKNEKKPMSALKFWLIMGAVAVAGLILDQVTKYVVQTNLTQDDKIPVIGDFVYFTYAKNWGASFGMLKDWEYRNVVFFIITLIGVPAFGYLLGKRRGDHMLGSVGLAMMISGALGNAIDRFMYSTGFYDGYVRDFIGVKYFAIFNVADSCMCVGIAILLISMLFFDKERPFNNAEAKAEERAAAAEKRKREKIDETLGLLESYSASEKRGDGKENR